jgi:hypothetical protein
MTQQAKLDVEESEEEIEALEDQIAELKEDWEEEASEIRERWSEVLEDIDEVEITPRRADVMVSFCGPAWVPAWRVVLESGQVLELPAREDIS